MMTRISTFSQQSTVLDQTLRRQSAMNSSQNQVSSGKKAETYSGYGADVSALISARAVKSRTEVYKDTVTRLSGRLDQVNIHVGAVGDAAKNLKQAILDGMALEDGVTLDVSLENNFQSVVRSLNAQYNGEYLFGDNKFNTKPVNVSTTADLALAAAPADVFDVENSKATTRVADGQDIKHGILANEMAESVFKVFRDIKLYNDDVLTGPLTGKLDATKTAFLETKLKELETAIQGVSGFEQQNGQRQKQLVELEGYHSQRLLGLGKLVSDIEDVDMTQAISNLQNDQTALQASFRVLSQVNRVSLNDYL
jgi:flagellar hook-associated protein 3 FlgL